MRTSNAAPARSARVSAIWNVATAPSSRRSAAGRCAAGALHALQPIGNRRAHRRKDAGDDRRQKRGDEPECENGPADTDGVRPWNCLAADRLQDGDDPGRQCRAHNAADQRQRDALVDHLSEQPPLTGPQRRTHRVFLLPLKPTGQQKPGDVGAGDEEDQRDRAEERHEQLPPVAIQDVGNWRCRGRQALQARIRADEPGANRGRLRLRLAGRCPTPEPGNNISSGQFRARLVRRHREPEVHAGVEVVVWLARGAGIGKKTKSRRHDADHRQGGGHAADANRLPDDVRIAVEFSLPEVIAENDRRRRRLEVLSLGIQELAAENRLHPQHSEVVRADDHPTQRLTPVVPDQEVEAPPIHGRSLERTSLAPRNPVPGRRPFRGGLTVEPCRSQEHQPVRFRIGRRREKDTLNQPEHGRGGANPEAERRNGERGKAGILSELSECVAKILEHGCLVILCPSNPGAFSRGKPSEGARRMSAPHSMEIVRARLDGTSERRDSNGKPRRPGTPRPGRYRTRKRRRRTRRDLS